MSLASIEIDGGAAGSIAGSCSSKAQSRDLYSAELSSTAGEGCRLVESGSSPLPANFFDGLEWDSYPSGSAPLYAGKASKPSRGSGQSPDTSSRCDAGSVAIGAGIFSASSADGLSLLDSLKNNRHSGQIPDYAKRPQNRGKYCGRMSVKGDNPKTGATDYRRVNCKSWSCSYCGPRRARTARAAIRSAAEALNLRYFLTLTLDPKKIPNKKDQIKYLKTTYNKFREYLKRKFGVAPKYISVVELTQAGVPHLHILFDRYIPQAWISNVWSRLGGGRIVFIKQVTVMKVARYLSKYLTKELLLSAPKGTRRITTARGIKLFPKFQSEIAWDLVKSSIWWLLQQERGRGRMEQSDFFSSTPISIEFDSENFLTAFAVHLPILAP